MTSFYVPTALRAIFLVLTRGSITQWTSKEDGRAKELLSFWATWCWSHRWMQAMLAAVLCFALGSAVLSSILIDSSQLWNASRGMLSVVLLFAYLLSSLGGFLPVRLNDSEPLRTRLMNSLGSARARRGKAELLSRQAELLVMDVGYLERLSRAPRAQQVRPATRQKQMVRAR